MNEDLKKALELVKQHEEAKQKKLEEFQAELKELLEKYQVELVAMPCQINVKLKDE